jgi:hypothetical protein
MSNNTNQNSEINKMLVAFLSSSIPYVIINDNDSPFLIKYTNNYNGYPLVLIMETSIYDKLKHHSKDKLYFRFNGKFYNTIIDSDGNPRIFINKENQVHYNSEYSVLCKELDSDVLKKIPYLEIVLAKMYDIGSFIIKK